MSVVREDQRCPNHLPTPKGAAGFGVPARKGHTNVKAKYHEVTTNEAGHAATVRQFQGRRPGEQTLERSIADPPRHQPGWVLTANDALSGGDRERQHENTNEH